MLLFMMTRDAILDQLRCQKPRLASFGVSAIGLFGSYNRKAASAASDIDVLIDFHAEKENFDNFMAVCEVLEAAFLGKKIEIITKNGMSPYIGPVILKEVTYV